MFKISKIHARLQKTIIGRLVGTKPRKHKHQERMAQPVIHPLVVDTTQVASIKVPEEEPKKYVIFMGRDAVSHYKFAKNDVLISISDTGTPAPELLHQPRAVLALSFHDYVTKEDIDDLGWRQMNRQDAAAINEFVLKYIDAADIVVHCNVGQSRSKAVALAISNILGRDALHGNDYGYTALYKESDNSIYNRRIYEMIMMEHYRSSDAEKIFPST